MKKDQKWGWGNMEHWAFNEIKGHITSSPILHFVDDLKVFRIEANSFDYATGSVLSQQLSDDLKWHPITFYLKSLNAIKQNYEIHDKEMLAVMRSLEEWQHFLKDVKHKVKIWMDHKNLKYFMTVKKLNHRQARWSLYLSRFNFIMHHHPEKSMGKLWMLSCIVLTTAMVPTMTMTPHYFNPNSSPFGHSRESLLKELRGNCCTKFGREFEMDEVRMW